MEFAPWMVDAILIGVIIEFLIFSALLRKIRAVHLIAPLFFFLLSGGLLLLALRLALTETSLSLIPVALLLAFFSHAGFLVLVFRRRLL